ncbi:PhoU domain-containing protein [Streptococcus merionis]|uniref:Phosphate transport system regulatory protein n=1 Tax=Streptococcus merionis TaxID=400065 RepID=A0A239ST84_9STRE|nr:PhoU domain-containing protein [Streptococcus merionis]SNU88705.1 phosphate transport system regulatory protein [Streptococcus merionis]
MRAKLTYELRELQERYSHMGEMVRLQLSRLLLSMDDYDELAIKSIIEDDSSLNSYERKLTEKAVEVIALQNPVSVDLRHTIIILKACSDLERVGDHIVGIACSLLRLKGEKLSGELHQNLIDLLLAIQEKLESVFSLFVNGNMALALHRLEEWETAPEATFLESWILEQITNDVNQLMIGREYLNMLLHITKIEDFAKNLLKWVVYKKTGRLVG